MSAGLPRRKRPTAHWRLLICLCLSGCLGAAAAGPLPGQIESAEPSPSRFIWVSNGRLEGHLALDSSPAGAFSPDSATLAVVVGSKVVLFNTSAGDVRKVLQPRVEKITDLEIQSANFLGPSRLFILASGLLPAKNKDLAPRTPPLAFQWDTEQDALSGKVNTIGAGKSIGPLHYLPRIGYLAFYNEGNFDLWQPATGDGRRAAVPDLKYQPHLFAFSPDGKWLLLAQIEMDSSVDPAVVRLSDGRFVDSLRGHLKTVLSMSFSRDAQKVVTASEDGVVRVWSVGDWKLLKTLTGHRGAVPWAEFSPDGNWLASAGNDKRVRIWSVGDGRLVQMLRESTSPLRTVAFSPNGEYVAASGEDVVLVWKRQRMD